MWWSQIAYIKHSIFCKRSFWFNVWFRKWRNDCFVTKWQLNFHFLQPNTLVYLVYSVVTWFSKWQHVCENLFYKNETWRLFQIFSLLQWSNVFYHVIKWLFQSTFIFFNNDSHLSNLLFKEIFQIFTYTMFNFGVFNLQLDVFNIISDYFYYFHNEQSIIFCYKIFIQENKYISL